MVRTQIQLTDEQARDLRKLADKESVSLAELIRRGVETLRNRSVSVTDEERRARALSAIGTFRCDGARLSTNHDQAFGESH